MAELEATFGCPVIESYGMTEAAHQMASNPLPPGARKPGSVGVAAGPEVGDHGRRTARCCRPATIGEIVIRGPNVTGGYENNPEANARRPSRTAGSTPATRARWTPTAMSASPAG